MIVYRPRPTASAMAFRLTPTAGRTLLYDVGGRTRLDRFQEACRRSQYPAPRDYSRLAEIRGHKPAARTVAYGDGTRHALKNTAVESRAGVTNRHVDNSHCGRAASGVGRDAGSIPAPFSAAGRFSRRVSD